MVLYVGLTILDLLAVGDTDSLKQLTEQRKNTNFNSRLGDMQGLSQDLEPEGP